jgi:poly-gamma-glutamate capsule biosynthesis protein CapA/YwtB (metallophosphatase superfamily)
VPPGEVKLAHALIDAAGVDLVHGHSSHRPKGIEVYRRRVVLVYLVTIDSDTGEIVEMNLIPFSMRRLHLNRAPPEDGRGLAEVLWREGRRWRTTVRVATDGTLCLRWEADAARDAIRDISGSTGGEYGPARRTHFRRG